MKIYEKIEGQEYKVEVYYNKGGYNNWTDKYESRGYYVSVAPVKRERKDGYISERMNPREAVKKCIQEVGRKSDKQYMVAVEKANNGEINALYEYLGVDRTKAEVSLEENVC